MLAGRRILMQKRTGLMRRRQHCIAACQSTSMDPLPAFTVLLCPALLCSLLRWPLLQVGDLLDRGDHEIPLLYWLERLRWQAAAAGGALHVLNGNHETMNVAGQYRYVTRGGMHRWGLCGACCVCAWCGGRMQSAAGFPTWMLGKHF